MADVDYRARPADTVPATHEIAGPTFAELLGACPSPKSPLVESAHDTHFLMIQPNHEVVAYLDAADASAVWPLAQMARRDSSTAGLVQTFSLTRDSIYQSLESGLHLDEIPAIPDR